MFSSIALKCICCGENRVGTGIALYIAVWPHNNTKKKGGNILQDVFSLIGILLAIAVLIFLAFRGINVIFLTIAASIIIALFSQQNIIETITGTYAAGFGAFVSGYLVLLLVSALYGEVMNRTGAARTIAITLTRLCRRFRNQKLAAIVIVGVGLGAVLTYGGVNLFVIIFLMLPIVRTLFEELDIPWHLYFCGTLGASTFTMGYLPGTPQIQNIIPTQYLGTTVNAAPVLGIIATIITLALGIAYIWYALRKTEKAGEGFYPTGESVSKAIPREDLSDEVSAVKFILAVTPSVTMIVLMLLSVNVYIALVAAIVLLLIFNFPVLSQLDFKKIMTDSASNATLATLNTSAIIAFGAVVAAAPGFAYVTSLLLKIPGPPMVQYLIAVEVAAGICGSSSGGLGVALSTFGEHFLSMGLNPAAMHRLGAIASCGLDSLPHTSGIYTNLALSRLTHAQAYKHQFWLTVVIPIITLVIVTAFYSVTGIL